MCDLLVIAIHCSRAIFSLEITHRSSLNYSIGIAVPSWVPRCVFRIFCQSVTVVPLSDVLGGSVSVAQGQGTRGAYQATALVLQLWRLPLPNCEARRASSAPNSSPPHNIPDETTHCPSSLPMPVRCCSLPFHFFPLIPPKATLYSSIVMPQRATSFDPLPCSVHNTARLHIPPPKSHVHPASQHPHRVLP